MHEVVAQRYGAAASARLQHWQQQLQQWQSLATSTQLQRVNDLANQMQSLTDQALWGSNDYWATTAEFVGAGGGDCEDFSIAKFDALLQLGIAPQQLRLVYVKAEQLQEYHMVLAYYPKPDAIPLLLDNLNPAILSADKRPDLTPVFSFNAAQLWLNVNRFQSQSVGNINNFSQWQQLQHRDQPRLPKLQLPFAQGTVR